MGDRPLDDAPLVSGASAHQSVDDVGHAPRHALDGINPGQAASHAGAIVRPGEIIMADCGARHQPERALQAVIAAASRDMPLAAAGALARRRRPIVLGKRVTARKTIPGTVSRYWPEAGSNSSSSHRSSRSV